MSISIGTAIYIAIKPLTKVFLNCAMGYLLARRNILTVQTCQKISLLIINFLLPALVFYNVVNSLSINEIKTIASLALSAFIFEAIGLVFGLIVRLLTPNPRRWFGGIMAAGAFNNSSDLPIAYVTTLAASSFFPANAESRGTAYSVIYMVVFCISVFNLGGFKLIASDCQLAKLPEKEEIADPIISAENFRKIYKKLKNNRSASNSDLNETSSEHSINHHRAFYEANEEQRPKNGAQSSENELSAYGISTAGNASTTESLFGNFSGEVRGNSENRRKQKSSSSAVNQGLSDTENPETSHSLYRPQTLDDVVKSYSRNSRNEPINADFNQSDEDELVAQPQLPKRSELLKQWFKRHKITFVYDFIADFKRPQSLAMIIALICALVPQIRALFKQPTYPSNIPNAPDGLPCLDFIMSFGKFIGNASVPLGLSVLGATIARLKLGNLPKGFWKSVILMTCLKLIILPIIAIKWAQKMRDMNWIDKDDNMAFIVTVVTSAVPTATSQLYITAMFTNPEVDQLQMDCTAAHILCQYSLLLFSLTFIITYLLKVIIEI